MNIENLFKQKRVVIVGPAESTLLNKNGSIIDSYDIIVRVNRGIEPISEYSEYIGTRTDVLYNCMLERPDNGGIINVNELQKNKVAIVIYHPEVSFSGVAYNKPPSTAIKPIKKLKDANIENCMIDYNFYNSISDKVKCRPNTGYIAIHHILSFDIKELYITGFTFYMDNFMAGYKEHLDNDKFTKKCFHSRRHNQENMFQHLKKCKFNDPRIKTDIFLTKILELDKLDRSKTDSIFK